jgi:hypothetical protein
VSACNLKWLKNLTIGGASRATSPTRPEAIRRHIEIGLKAKGK